MVPCSSGTCSSSSSGWQRWRPRRRRHRPERPDLEDQLFPGLGNGGYDVLHYHLDVRYATSAPSQPLDGTVTIVARATQSLSRFDLDFAGDSIGSVAVDGDGAAWRRDGEELVITPRHPLRRGQARSSCASSTSRRRRRCPATRLGSTAFFITPDGSATAPQPDLAHHIFPSNDHPRDKASYSFRIDVPAGEVAIANGVPTGRRTHGGRTVWTYVQRQPMASELLQLAAGRYDLLPQGSHRGVPLRDVVAPGLEGLVAPALPLEPEQLDYMIDRVGRYPFDIFGTFVVEADLGFALETQTISLLDPSWFDRLHAGRLGPDDAARALAHVVRRQRVAVLVERSVAQRGPRELVRVPLRRGAGPARGRYRELPGSEPVTPTSTT